MQKKVQTKISLVSYEDIIIRGFPLTQLMGGLAFGDAAYLVLTGRKPNEPESRVFNALLVSLIEHGIHTQALAARWTVRMAPESLQGAIASAVLGVGSQFGGVAENVGKMLKDAIELRETEGLSLEQTASRVANEYAIEARYVPGLGHLIHKGGDPRAERLFQIAEEAGLPKEHTMLLKLIRDEVQKKKSRPLVINAMGAVGAIVLDLGLDWKIARGLMIISKIPGFLAHVLEEMQNPIMGDIAQEIRSTVEYAGETGKQL